MCRHTKSNKDSFNFLESLNTQSLSICYSPPTTSQLLSVHILVLAACLKEPETAEAAPTVCEPAPLFPVFAADCASLNDALLFSEITVVQSAKERSSTDVRNGSLCPGLIFPELPGGWEHALRGQQEKKNLHRKTTVECVRWCVVQGRDEKSEVKDVTVCDARPRAAEITCWCKGVQGPQTTFSLNLVSLCLPFPVTPLCAPY